MTNDGEIVYALPKTEKAGRGGVTPPVQSKSQIQPVGWVKNPSIFYRGRMGEANRLGQMKISIFIWGGTNPEVVNLLIA